MTTDPDDEALSWAGDPADTEPSRPTSGTAAPGVAGGWKVVGKPGRVASAQEPDAARQMSSVALVAHGILAGIYLLYTIGWLIAAQRDNTAPADIVGGVMHEVGLWFAVLAPALWIAAAIWLTRSSHPLRTRFLVLVIGAVMLIPWPFIVGGN